MAGVNNTNAIIFGGTPGGVTLTELWNGSNWTEVNDLNTGRTSLAGSGSYTSALAIGGGSDADYTESWNGTNWTNEADLNTARDLGGAAGADNTSGLYFAGRKPPTVYASTELWTKPSFTTKTISTD